MTIRADLQRARHLAFAADEGAARDLLLSLVPDIERADRDDLLLEVFAQLGEIYLVRGANDGVVECIRRIRDCLDIYSTILGRTMPQAAARVTMPDADILHMITRYSRRAWFLEAGVGAAQGDHQRAQHALTALADGAREPADLVDEHRYLLTHARILCASALCEDDLYMRSVPLWQNIIEVIAGPGDGTEPGDYLQVAGATGYGRFCVETGRLAEAEPWLRRAGARAEARGWELSSARTQLERAAASWSAGDQVSAERGVLGAYPVIARYARAHDVSRCWLFLGLAGMAVGELDRADEFFGHAERHWREVARPLHIHRILLQRSWVAILRGDFAAATELVAQARDHLDAWPRRSWLQAARLDDHLGSIWRADALSDGNRASALDKLARAAELKVPAALAVDSVRYTIADADARMRWATYVSAPMLAGAFAVSWESENTALLRELIEYHSARGTFHIPPGPVQAAEWTGTATAPVPVDEAGHRGQAADFTIRLGPLPPLQMDPDGAMVLGRYRALAFERYGREVTADETAWLTCP